MLERISQYLSERSWDRIRAKMLVDFVVKNDRELSDTEIEAIFNCFLIEKWILDWENNSIELSFEDSQEKKSIKLISLSEIAWVNQLLWWQVLEFSKNLTVVYGQNACGKTGYSRILKSLWSSYDIQADVLWDVLGNSAQSQQCCKVKFIEDWDITEKEIERTWNWSVSLPIWLFNSSCVDYWLEARQLTFTPHGFHLFDICKNSLTRLSNLLNAKISILTQDIKTQILFVDTLKGLDTRTFINNLSQSSTESEIDNFVWKTAEVLSDEKKELEENQKNNNKELITTKNQLILNKLSELNSLKSIIISYQKVFSDEKRKEYVANNASLSELEKQPKSTIEEIAKDKWVAFYESSEFKEFINKADSYLSKIWSDELGICPYCRQDTSPDALALLLAYHNALHNDTQEKINSATRDIESFEKEVNWISIFVSHHNCFGKNELWEAILPDIIKNIIELNQLYLVNKINEDFLSNIDFKEALRLIDVECTKSTTEQFQNTNSLKELDKKEIEFKDRISEIEDRILYLSKKDDIKNYIKNLMLQWKLKWIVSDLYAQSLSWMLTKAQNELITETYKATFTTERNTLNCPQFIEYNLRVEDWKTAINQSIFSNKLKDILSEWEQKSIALAEFITELKICWNSDPVIFDDPVNSLDHQRLELVASRLFELAKERQVIIFTHNIFLFYKFEELYEENWKVDWFEYVPYLVDRQWDNTWALYKNIPISLEKYKEYKTKINRQLNNSPKETPERDIVIECYNYLRSMIELLVEDWCFCWIVKRHQPSVKMTKFNSVDWDLIKQYKDVIMNIYNKSCRLNKWHSSSLWSVTIPTKNELITDFETIVTIWAKFQFLPK